MIYVVSGYTRTGTSMMMRAVQAGGMTLTYDDVQDKRLKHTSDDHYHLQHGRPVYEPSAKMFGTFGFPRAHDGTCLKILHGGLDKMAPHEGGYRVVFMLRDPEEIRQSRQALFLRDRPPAWLTRPGGYEDRMQYALDVLDNRRDVLAVTVLEYRSVLDDPVAAFTELRDTGWPLDVEAAASVVDPSKCRYKLEELEVGI